MIINFVDFVGEKGIYACNKIGNLGIFFYDTILTLFTTKPKIKKIFNQMNYIGVQSLGIIVLIGVTIGAVLAIQTYVGLHKFGAEQFMGPIIFLSLSRELSPVLTAIMVIGRAGSATTAEIGTMRITEQIDALQTLCIHVKQYLIVPRIVASTVVLPFLSVFCTFVGIFSGYFISVYSLGVNPETFWDAIVENVELWDITHGLIKAGIFGILLSLICTYKGFITKGGAKGVGKATTQAVVYANVTIFIADYILTSLLMD